MKKLHNRTKFTIVAIFNITWYTIAVLYLSSKGTTVPSELTIAFFAAWTAELGILYGIKKLGKND